MGTSKENLYAQLNANLANTRAIANTIRDTFGDDVPSRLDLDYAVDHAFWNGMGPMRGDGAVHLQGFDEVVAESLNSSNAAEKKWAEEDGQKAPWFFIFAATQHPDLQQHSADEQYRLKFQISTNASYARFRQANFGFPHEVLALSPWFAFQYVDSGDGTPIEGELIKDARSLPDSMTGSGGSVFQGATPQTARQIALFVRSQWIKSHSREAANHGWPGVWTGQ